MDDNDITIIVGMETQGAGKAMAENARRTVGNNDRTQLHTLNPQIPNTHPHPPNPHTPNPHTLKETTGSGAFPNDAKEESKRAKELMLQAGGFAESPSPSKLGLKASQAVYCVSNHIAKATFRSPSTSEQGSGAANSTSASILPHETSRSNPLMLRLPVRSFMSTGSSSASRASVPTLLSASTPCIPTEASLYTPSTAAASTLAASSTPTLSITRTRTSASASALSIFRSLKSALKGKGKAKDRRRTLSFPAELGGGTSTTSLPPAATPTATTSSHKYSTIHLPLSTIFHGLRNGYKPVRSPSDGILRMLPAPVIQTHQPSLSPPPVPPPASTIKRKRDLWRNLKLGSSSRRALQNKSASGQSQRNLFSDEDASSVLDLGHIPLPSPLLYETCTIAPPNPNPKYTVTIHLNHPGQKLEYEMDNMTGHLLIMIYTPHYGFSTISGVIGGGSSRKAVSSFDEYDDPYGYDTASRAGGIWIPQQFDWNGLRVRDWGSVTGKVVFQFPEYVRVGRGGDEWNEREVMPPDMSEEVVEMVLDEGDLDACVIKEGKWDEKGKGKGKAAPDAKTGGKRKGKDKEIAGGGARAKLGSRYDLRPRS